jgi:hypothetical protein
MQIRSTQTAAVRLSPTFWWISASGEHTVALLVFMPSSPHDRCSSPEPRLQVVVPLRKFAVSPMQG